MEGLARIPLFLSLLCRVYQEETATLPQRRVDLYGRCLRGLLFEWQKEKGYVSGLRSEYTLARLEKAAVSLFPREQFDDAELAQSLGYFPTGWEQVRQAENEIAFLVHCGILVSTGTGHKMFLQPNLPGVPCYRRRVPARPPSP